MFGCHKRHAVAWYANPEGQRSHECERGTQECVRHNDSIFYEASPKTKRHWSMNVSTECYLIAASIVLFPGVRR
jgi:hypothetical protein